MGNLPTSGPCGDRNKPVSVCVADYFFSNLDDSDELPTSPTMGLVSALSGELNRLTDENRVLLSEIKRRKAGDVISLSRERDLLKSRLASLEPKLALAESELESISRQRSEDLTRLQAETKLLTDQLGYLSREYELVKSELEKSENIGVELQTLKLEKELLNSNLGQLNARFTLLGNEKKALRIEIETLKLEKESQRWDVEAVEKSNKELLKQNSSLEAQQSKMKMAMEEANSNLVGLGKALRQAKFELDVERAKKAGTPTPSIVRPKPTKSRQRLWDTVVDAGFVSPASPASPALFGA